MVMKRFSSVIQVVAAVSLLGGAGACNKPSADDCQKAILKVEQLLGTDTSTKAVDNQGEVRRCRGGSTKESVACAINANTVDELKACAFMSKPKTP
jgi:hypothetical protein